MLLITSFAAIDFSNENFDLLAVALVGVAFVVIGNYKWQQFKKLTKTGIRVEGVVFEIISERSSHSSSIYYYPVIRYVTFEKEWITQKCTTGSTPSFYNVGDKVKVIYDVADNTNFIIDNNMARVLGPVLFYVGCFILLFTIIQFAFHPFSFH